MAEATHLKQATSHTNALRDCCCWPEITSVQSLWGLYTSKS